MSRKAIPIRITEYIKSDITIENEMHTFTSISNLKNISKFDLLCWLAERRLIKNEQFCGDCLKNMRLTKNTKTKAGYIWSCKRPCKISKSVLVSSFFSDSKSPLESILLFLNMWSQKYSQEQIRDNLQINKNTLVEWCKDVREICMVRMLHVSAEIGGFNENGNPITVEIDESLFFRRKYNRGRFRNAQWVFGAIERESKKCFLVPVPDRTRETLLEIIRLRIRPGSRIISDGWPAYRALVDDDNYEYDFVIHSENFVSPHNPDIHTQNIENVWLHAKRILRKQFGSTEELLEGYLYEFMFRKYFSKTKIFNQLILTLINYF